MKKYLFIIGIAFLGLSSCKKETIEPVGQEVENAATVDEEIRIYG